MVGYKFGMSAKSLGGGAASASTQCLRQGHQRCKDLQGVELMNDLKGCRGSLTSYKR